MPKKDAAPYLLLNYSGDLTQPRASTRRWTCSCGGRPYVHCGVEARREVENPRTRRAHLAPRRVSRALWDAAANGGVSQRMMARELPTSSAGAAAWAVARGDDAEREGEV